MTWSNILRELWNVANKYYVIAGIAFLIFYVLLRKRNLGKKIQRRYPGAHDYRRELIFSTISIVIFSLPPIILLHEPHLRPHTTIYTDIRQHGWWYFFAAFPLMFLIHDTYFYWTHRLIHHPLLFKWVHLVHHRSVNPSPWAAYAFHPVEALLESQIFVIFLFTIPMNVWHLFIFFLLSLAYNVYGHLGFELYPAGFNRHWLGRWVNTSVSHNLHHHHFNGNYGLYFLFWDRWMGTLRKDYDASFGEVTMRGKVAGGNAAGAGDTGEGNGDMAAGKGDMAAGKGKGIMLSSLLLLAGLAGVHGVQGQVKADDVLGVWLTHGDKPAKVQIYKTGDQYDGKIIWLQYPTENGRPKTDSKNPDQNKQSRPLMGLGILTGFRFDTDDWEGGHIYDPESGKTYSCTMTLKDPGTLKVRGYIGFSWIGRTEVWTRVGN